MFRAVLVVVLSSMSLTAFAQTSDGWQPYIDRAHGFSAELPLGTFEASDTGGTPGMTLREIGGQATIKLYGGPAQGVTREALEARLANGGQVDNITYRAGGDSWFALSGYYDGSQRQGTIFYTKVLFSPDRKTFSAFEITFPAGDKPRFEPLVEYFEDKFTRPQS